MGICLCRNCGFFALFAHILTLCIGMQNKLLIEFFRKLLKIQRKYDIIGYPRITINK